MLYYYLKMGGIEKCILSEREGGEARSSQTATRLLAMLWFESLILGPGDYLKGDATLCGL
jgi:hypothetical protein